MEFATAEAASTSSVVTTHTTNANHALGGILSIPPELVLGISSYMGQTERCRLIQTCRQLHNYLLETLYDQDAKEDDNYALAWACWKNKVSTLDIVLSFNPALVNSHFESNHPINRAQNQQPQQGIRFRWVKGMSPLAVATRRGKIKVLQRLIERNADVNFPDVEEPWSAPGTIATPGLFPINIAMKIREMDTKIRIIGILIAHGADINQKPQGSDENLGPLDDAPIFQVIDLPFPDKTPYQYPGADHIKYKRSISKSFQDQLDLLQTLLRLGADPNLRDNKGRTPLLRFVHLLSYYIETFTFDSRYASMSDKLEQRAIVQDSILEHIKILIRYGADPNATAEVAAGSHPNVEERKTALHLACCLRKGHEELVEYLVQQGSDVNAASDSGRTPIYEYCDLPRDLGIFEWLIENGADVNHQDNQGLTPLHALNRMGRERPINVVGRTECARILVQHGADLTLRDDDGFTAEDYAKQADDKDTKNFLAKTRKNRARKNRGRPEYTGKALEDKNSSTSNVEIEARPASTPQHAEPDAGRNKGSSSAEQRHTSTRAHENGEYLPRATASRNRHLTNVQKIINESAAENHGLPATNKAPGISRATQRPQNPAAEQHLHRTNPNWRNRDSNKRQGENTQRRGGPAAPQAQGEPASARTSQALNGRQQRGTADSGQSRGRGQKRGMGSWGGHKENGQAKETEDPPSLI